MDVQSYEADVLSAFVNDSDKIALGDIGRRLEREGLVSKVPSLFHHVDKYRITEFGKVIRDGI